MFPGAPYQEPESILSPRPLSLATTESDLTAIAGKRLSMMTVAASIAQTQDSPEAMSNSTPLPSDSPPVEITAASAAGEESIASRSDRGVGSMSSPDDMYRRLSTASMLERTREMPSLAQILGKIQDGEQPSRSRPPTPPLNIRRPSSRASSRPITPGVRRLSFFLSGQ